MYVERNTSVTFMRIESRSIVVAYLGQFYDFRSAGPEPLSVGTRHADAM